MKFRLYTSFQSALQGPAPPEEEAEGARLRVPAVRRRVPLARQAAVAQGDARGEAQGVLVLQRQVRARRLAHAPRASHAQRVLRRRRAARQAPERAVPHLQTGETNNIPNSAFTNSHSSSSS